MTEFDRSTGILKLSLEDAHDYHSTIDRLPDESPPMEFYAEKLREFGYKVITVSDNYLEVEATQNEIWELLSGQHTYL